METSGDMSSVDPAHLRRLYMDILERRPTTQAQADQVVTSLRQHILEFGLPDDTPEEEATRRDRCSLRARVWKILLGVPRTDADYYFSLLQKGKVGLEEANDKIYRDLHRTWGFMEKDGYDLPEDESIARVLNAYLREGKGSPARTYQQGMNNLVGTFLYVMPELDAFYCFRQFAALNRQYLITSADGTVVPGQKDGQALVNVVSSNVGSVGMKMIDHLQEAFHSKLFMPGPLLTPLISSFHATAQPLSGVVHLWDYYVAFGFCNNIYVLVAEMIICRSNLLPFLQYKAKKENMPDWRKLLEFANQVALRVPPNTAHQVARHTSS